jgi:hypothetical protein
LRDVKKTVPAYAGTVGEVSGELGRDLHPRQLQEAYFFLAAFFLVAFFLAAFFLVAIVVLQLRVSPGVEYIHKKSNYKQLSFSCAMPRRYQV